MKKKILVFHPIIAPYRIDLFNTLADRFDAEVCLYWRNLKDQSFDYAQLEQQFKFTPLYIIKEELGTVRWAFTVWKKITESKPDIVIVNEFLLAAFVTAAHRMLTRGKYKIVSLVDDSYKMVTDPNFFPWRHKKEVDVLAPQLDEIINVEPRVAEWYQNRYGRGYYFPIICDDVKARERLQRLLPLSDQYVEQYQLEGKRVLLFVGRLVHLKNLERVIPAFLKVAPSDARFVIVGDGSERERLYALAEGHDNIIFTGRLEGDALYAWYNVASCSILASYQEAFGAVVNEALLGGCMAIVSKVAGSQCLIEEGSNGFLVDPENEEEIAEKIHLALANDNPYLGALRPDKMPDTYVNLSNALIEHLEQL